MGNGPLVHKVDAAVEAAVEAFIYTVGQQSHTLMRTTSGRR